MPDLLKSLSEKQIQWALAQKVFFVSTAPLDAGGYINTSPKGGNCFCFPDPNTFVYADYTGSGTETIAHLHENGRILILFCAFAGPPQILRLHGSGRAWLPGQSGFQKGLNLLPSNPGIRSIIEVHIHRASVSCGFGVPKYDFVGDRDQLDKWAVNKGPEGLAKYRQEKNRTSIDGLPGYGLLIDED